MLPEKVTISKYNHTLLFEKKRPKKLIIIDKMYGILWYKHNLHAGINKICSMNKADKIVKRLKIKITA